MRPHYICPPMVPTNPYIEFTEDLGLFAGMQVEAAYAQISAPFLEIPAAQAIVELESVLRAELTQHLSVPGDTVEEVFAAMPAASPEAHRVALLGLSAVLAVVYANSLEHLFTEALNRSGSVPF